MLYLLYFKLFFFFQGVTFLVINTRYYNVTLLACPNTGSLISHSEMFYSLNPLNKTHRGVDENAGQGVKIHVQLIVYVLTVLLVFGPHASEEFWESSPGGYKSQ